MNEHGDQAARGMLRIILPWLTVLAAIATVAQVFIMLRPGGGGEYVPPTTQIGPSDPTPPPDSPTTTVPSTTTTTSRPSRAATTTRPAISGSDPVLAGCLAPELAVAPTTVRRGETLKVAGCGFWPNDRVFGFMGRSYPFTEQPVDLGSLITDGEGAFTAAFRIPRSIAPGPAVIQYAPLDAEQGSATVALTIR